MSSEIVKQQQPDPKPLMPVTDAELIMHLTNLGLLTQLTEGEKNTYLQICKAFNLNPFKREVHVSKYNGQMSIITGYEVYIKRAERLGVLNGWKVYTEGSIAEGNLKGVVVINRKDWDNPFIWESEYKEFVQLTKDGAVTKFWKKAEFMIKKVAISQGFRLCFSDELGGMPYTKEEMPDVEEADATLVSSTVKQNRTAPPVKVETNKAVLTEKKPLATKAFNAALARIVDGEKLAKISRETFALTPEQDKALTYFERWYDKINKSDESELKTLYTEHETTIVASERIQKMFKDKTDRLNIPA